MAKALGLRVQFADSVRGGTANAQISGDTILIEKDNPNPVLAIAGHEFGHRLQELAPEEYRRFRESILEGREHEVRDKAAQYAKQGVNVTYEEAMNEVANDQAGLLMDGGEVLDRFIEQHRTDRTLLQKMRDAIRSFIDKVTGKERKRLETAEGKLEAALKAAAREAKALQDKAGRDTMGAEKYSLKEDGVGGREGTRRIGAVEQKEKSDRAGGQSVQNSAGEVLQGNAVSRGERGLNTSFGERPYYAWTEGHVIEPVRGTVAHGAQQTAVEYGVPSFVVSNTAWNRSKTKAPSFSAHGQIFFRESIPERYRGMVAPHEITHVMKQVQYPAYLAFVSKTPDMLDLSSIEAALLLENSAKHRGIDIFNEKGTLDTRKLKALSEADTLKLYDELNATLYGHIDSGKMEGLSEPLRHAFHDFDAYAKELTELHERFKAENGKGETKFSLKAPVEETRDLVAVHNLTEYAESGRWQSAAEQSKSLQDKAASDTMDVTRHSLKEDENNGTVRRNQTESPGAGASGAASARAGQAPDTRRSGQNRQGMGSEVRSEVGSTVRREDFLREHRERGDRSVRLKGDCLYAYHEATPLYAVGGKKAAEQYAKFRIWMEGIKNETDGNRTSFDRWNGSIQSAPWNQRTNLSDTGRRETVSGHDSLYAGASEGNRGGTPGTGAENRRVNSKFSLKAPVEETRDLVAASAPTEYAESGRWQSAAEQSKSLQDKVASDTMDVTRHSLKEDGVDGQEADRNRGIGQQADRGITEKGQQGTNRRREAGNQETGRVLDSHGQRYGGLNSSFGAKPYRSWAEGHVIEPTRGTVAYGEQQTAMEYHVPSFVVSDEA